MVHVSCLFVSFRAQKKRPKYAESNVGYWSGAIYSVSRSNLSHQRIMSKHLSETRLLLFSMYWHCSDGLNISSLNHKYSEKL